MDTKIRKWAQLAEILEQGGKGALRQSLKRVAPKALKDITKNVGEGALKQSLKLIPRIIGETFETAVVNKRIFKLLTTLPIEDFEKTIGGSAKSAIENSIMSSVPTTTRHFFKKNGPIQALRMVVNKSDELPQEIAEKFADAGNTKRLFSSIDKTMSSLLKEDVAFSAFAKRYSASAGTIGKGLGYGIVGSQLVSFVTNLYEEYKNKANSISAKVKMLQDTLGSMIAPGIISNNEQSIVFVSKIKTSIKELQMIQGILTNAEAKFILENSDNDDEIKEKLSSSTNELFGVFRRLTTILNKILPTLDDYTRHFMSGDYNASLSVSKSRSYADIVRRSVEDIKNDILKTQQEITSKTKDINKAPEVSELEPPDDADLKKFNNENLNNLAKRAINIFAEVSSLLKYQ